MSINSSHLRLHPITLASLQRDTVLQGGAKLRLVKLSSTKLQHYFCDDYVCWITYTDCYLYFRIYFIQRVDGQFTAHTENKIFVINNINLYNCTICL